MSRKKSSSGTHLHMSNAQSPWSCTHSRLSHQLWAGSTCTPSSDFTSTRRLLQITCKTLLPLICVCSSWCLLRTNASHQNGRPESDGYDIAHLISKPLADVACGLPQGVCCVSGSCFVLAIPVVHPLMVDDPTPMSLDTKVTICCHPRPGRMITMRGAKRQDERERRAGQDQCAETFASYHA